MSDCTGAAEGCFQVVDALFESVYASGEKFESLGNIFHDFHPSGNPMPVSND